MPEAASKMTRNADNELIQPGPDDLRQSTIAWCGWCLTVLPEWRPLKIQGEFVKGSMMIGDGERPVLLVQWRRVDPHSFTPERWLEARFKTLHATPDAGAPRPPRFLASAWALDAEVREGQSKSTWYGYSARAGLLLECVTTNLGEEGAPRRKPLAEVLPSLRVTGPDEPCRWALFGVTFVSPTGFTLIRRHLYSGDIALGLAKSGREGLMLRQVYPAGLAVSRRSLSRWIETPPFKERRRQPEAPPQAWERSGAQGIIRQGWRRLPAPMGWCNPCYSTAVAGVDAGLDRLLLAEHQTRREHDAETAQWCVDHMNA